MAESGFRAGVVKASKVRDADEQKLKANAAEVQLLFALQDLAVEGLALAGEWTSYLRGVP